MSLIRLVLTQVLFFGLLGCLNSAKEPTVQDKNKSESSLPIHDQLVQESEVVALSQIEQTMIDSGLVDIRLLNPDVQVDLRYASDSNFLKKNIYGDLGKAYLEENTAKKLALAQYDLTSIDSNLHILIWDAARPITSQRMMWNALQMPTIEKGRFVSNPKNHSLHNYACAVDVTLVNFRGEMLDMGTDFDQFDTLAQPKYELSCVQRGLLTTDQVSNRMMLRNLMRRAGFTPIGSEWWHFNSCSREYAKMHYKLIP